MRKVGRRTRDGSNPRPCGRYDADFRLREASAVEVEIQEWVYAHVSQVLQEIVRLTPRDAPPPPPTIAVRTPAQGPATFCLFLPIKHIKLHDTSRGKTHALGAIAERGSEHADRNMPLLSKSILRGLNDGQALNRESV